ncbi:uncharacterized protein LOC122010270 isoform X1 [Zingiber officinale]|uniref:uncharacterized protein LOC122010270 isoform X1 n=1 Tax=Zingiber officinale TaxID=94328 RepID=UPI001C4D8B0B|nr:uncharacterized protein LOC122010270 isoform X1 [Zingiber officinale]
MAARSILEPLEICFSDLQLMSSHSPQLSPAELSRIESLTAAVMQALGPSGPGLLVITGVPRAPGLRRDLLPLARKIALLGRKDRARVLKDHSLGSDVPLKNPNRNVSSCALQLTYSQNLNSQLSSTTLKSAVENHYSGEGYPVNDCFDNLDVEFKNLGTTFKELGLCMMELGIQLAEVCDRAIGYTELKQSIIDGSAKGRLIHYHSAIDNIILKETNTRKKEFKRKTQQAENGIFPSNRCTMQRYPKERISKSISNLWQQWHYDYGIFTVLTSPLFMVSCQAEDCSHISCCQQSSSPDAHAYLQLFDIKKNIIYFVRSPPESFIVQVGEAADILTRGKLCSTLHSVSRPTDIQNLSRETFVVFLQPAWDKVLSSSEFPCLDETSNQVERLARNVSSVPKEENAPTRPTISDSEDAPELMQEILEKIPPLSIRYKKEMTFAEFSRETTKQYYSSSGTQSTR